MKSNNNYLDYIPVRNKQWNWDENPYGSVTLHIENRGILKRLTQKFLHKPEYSHIHLEQYGSCIWKLIDGQRTIYEIANMTDHQFGEDIHPLFDRIANYMNALKQHGLISYK